MHSTFFVIQCRNFIFSCKGDFNAFNIFSLSSTFKRMKPGFWTRFKNSQKQHFDSFVIIYNSRTDIINDYTFLYSNQYSKLQE